MMAEPVAPIAVVGMACRLPQAANSDELWNLLRQGRSAVKPIEELPAVTRQRVGCLRHGALLDDVASFDPSFFRIAPREARSMDPQQRLLLELSWHALENAGIRPSALRGSDCGVYIGISGSEYALESASRAGPYDPTQLTGSLTSIAANRLSYVLGLEGPSMAIDTACSSSLVAIHLACQALRAGEAGLAIAGGVSLILDDFITSVLYEAGVLSPRGRCRSFADGADGYVRGEGGGLLVLRPLQNALELGETIHAVVLGSAVNQDGASNGLMAPSRQAQENVLQRACKAAGISPAELDYLEAHGTGTLLGDPVEAKALGAVAGEGREATRPLRVGTIKTNLGHLEAAAGVAGVLKTSMMLRERTLVPSLNFDAPNPYIRFDRLRLAVQESLEPWPQRHETSLPLAGVSSFGIGGTNAHVVLQGPPASAAATETSRGLRSWPAVLPLSADGEPSLRVLADNYRSLLEGRSPSELAEIGHAAGTRRDHLATRALVRETNGDCMLDGLDSFVTRDRSPTTHRGAAPRVAFLFTGQGAQTPVMGQELYENEPLTREIVDHCFAKLDQLLAPDAERPLRDVIFGDLSEPLLIHETLYAQPALFTLEYAVARLWQSWGVEPSALLGHSVGELVAACLAGVYDLEQALALVADRAQAMQSSSPGRMLAASLSEDQARQALEDLGETVDLAAVNGPRQVVFAGAAEPIDRLRARLDSAGVRTRRLEVRRAFHSSLLDPVLPSFEEALEPFEAQPPALSLYSNVSGKLARGEVASASYWTHQARGTVRFADCLAAARRDGCDVLLEIGPDAVLTSLARGLEEETGAPDEPRPPLRANCASLRQGRGDLEQISATLASLYEAGVDIDWDAYCGRPRPATATSFSLPLYPFSRQSYWLDRTDHERRPSIVGSMETNTLEAKTTTTAADDEPSAPSTAENALDWVQRELHSITGHPRAQLEPDAELRDLGLSSLDLMTLATRLSRKLPALSEAEEPWAAAETLGDVIELVRNLAGDVDPPPWQEHQPTSEGRTSEPVAGVDGLRLVEEKATELRLLPIASELTVSRRLANQVVGPLEIVDGQLMAPLSVDEQHSFFFDHPYDHVPGLWFVEVAQQLAELVASAAQGLTKPPARFYVRELELRFERWAAPDAELQLAVAELIGDGTQTRIEAEIRDGASNSPCARVEVVLGNGVETSEQQRSIDAQRAVPPAPGWRVNKVRSENILISEPRSEGAHFVANAIEPNLEHLLSDGPGDFRSATELIELVRQFSTARGHGDDDVNAADEIRHRYILLTSHLRLREPILRTAPLELRSGATARAKSDAGRLAEVAVDLVVRNRVVGSLHLLGSAADERQYREARWGGGA